MSISRQTRTLIRQALREDIGKGDVTTESVVPSNLKAEAVIDAKANGILCGGEVVREVFHAVDSKLKVKILTADGARVKKGKKVVRISGRAASILKGERTALNFLSHLSAVATISNRYVQQVRGTRARIYDTRKTTPLWRELEKKAVQVGGGQNHRFGLWDEVLVKDNHWVVIKSLRGGQKGRRSNLRDCFASLAMTKKRMPVEIEVASIRELNQLLASFIPHRILFDNFSVPVLRKAVRIARKQRPGIRLEASGGITLANVRQVAKTGVDRISIGALTHSAPAVDFSLTLEKIVQ